MRVNGRNIFSIKPNSSTSTTVCPISDTGDVSCHNVAASGTITSKYVALNSATSYERPLVIRDTPASIVLYVTGNGDLAPRTATSLALYVTDSANINASMSHYWDISGKL